MKTYKSNNIECQAAEYGVDTEANQYVHLCYTSGDQIHKVPRDMLGKPKNAFNGVKTSSGWKQIEKGDVIVKQDDEISLISGSFFKNNFEEIKP